MRHFASALRRGISSCAFAIAGFAATSHAQLPDWGTLGVATSGGVQFEQSWVLSQTGNKITAFSGYSRQWTSITTASPGAITRSNEHFIVKDGGTFWGYSSHSGQFSPLVTLSGTATLLATTSPQTWLSIVQDGKTVYAYFAFTGQWHTFVFPTIPAVTYRNFCAEISDGTFLYGVSAYHETLVPLLAPGATALGCFGTVAMASSPGQVHAFSVHQNRWAMTSVSGTPSISNGFAANPGYVLVQDGASLQFFSGAAGLFTTAPAAPTASVQLHRQCALVIEGATVHGYSGLLGTFATTRLAAPPQFTILQHYFAAAHDGTALHVYSAPKGAFATPLPSSATVSFLTGQNVGVALNDATPIAGYSAFTNAWIAAPPLTSVAAYVGGSAAVLVDTVSGFGVYGMSVYQTSGWVPGPAIVPDAVYQPNTPQGLSSLIVVRQANGLFAFSLKTELWRDVTMAGSFLASAGHYTSAVFTDGIQAYGFGIHNDRWSVEPLSAPPAPADVKAQVNSGYVFDGSTLHAYTALGQTTTGNEYPDYIRNVVVGGLLRIDLAGEPGSQDFLLASPAGASLSVPGIGTLWIDLTLSFLLAAPTLPGTGLSQVLLQVPPVPAFSGVSLFLQSLIANEASLYLTNHCRVTIY